MKNQVEVWKDVKGYEGYYKCSNIGNIRRLKRVVLCKNGVVKTLPEKQVKKHVGYYGYYVVSLYVNNKQNVVFVHKVVAIAFLNHVPSKYKEVVDHIDNNPLNNNVSNLQTTTNRNNCSKDRRNKTSKYTGVCWHIRSNKWRAQIYYLGKQKYLGGFNSEKRASEAYQKFLSKVN